MFLDNNNISNQKDIMNNEITELLSESVLRVESSIPSVIETQLTNQRNIRIVDLNDRIILKKINNGEYVEAETLLKQLQSLIKSTNYGENKLTMYYHLSIYEYNIACVYQKLWKNADSRIHIQRSLDYQAQQIEQYKRDEDKIQKKIEIIKCYLQYCAVLSQLGCHDESLDISKKIIKIEKQIFLRCLKFCQDYYARNPQNPIIEISPTIRFQSLLINEAYEKLEHLASIPLADDVLREYRDRFQTISESIYYWKNTPENNEKLMRKELGISCGDSNVIRNVLGIKKNDEWVQSFNIGSAMMMKPRTITTKNKVQSDFLYIISSKSLLEQIFYTSIAYFTIATEIRFKQVDNTMKNLKVNEKAIKMADNQYVKVCKVFHLKAIQLVGKYVSSSSQYINHLILSFNKNYKSFMDAINEESFVSDSRISHNNNHINSKIHIEQQERQKLHCQKNQPEKGKTINFIEQEFVKTSAEPLNRKKSLNSRVRSKTKDSTSQPKRKVTQNINKRTQRTKSSNANKRTQRLKSEPLLKKHEEIKTFTFKFTKQVKQLSHPFDSNPKLKKPHSKKNLLKPLNQKK